MAFSFEKTPDNTANLASVIDHTKLTFALGDDQEALIQQLCQEAQTYQFAAVCVRPRHALQARRLLGVTSPIKLAAVIGFPEEPVTREEEAEYPRIGACETTTKLQEIAESISYGVDELDIVMNNAFFKADLECGGNFTEQELNAFVQCVGGEALIKLIIETDLLNEEQIRKAVRLGVAAGVDCIKTSTGMLREGQGATPELISLIASELEALGASETVFIKASGGIRTAEQARALLAAGASRLGTSAGVALCAAQSLAPPASAY